MNDEHVLLKSVTEAISTRLEEVLEDKKEFYLHDIIEAIDPVEVLIPDALRKFIVGSLKQKIEKGKLEFDPQTYKYSVISNNNVLGQLGYN